MNAALIQILAELAVSVVKLLPSLLRSVRDGEAAEAERLLQRMLKAQAAKAAIRRGTGRK